MCVMEPIFTKRPADYRGACAVCGATIRTVAKVCRRCYSNPLPKCADCGKQLTNRGTVRCRECRDRLISKHHPCVDCGRMIQRASTRCRACFVGSPPTCVDCGKRLRKRADERPPTLCRECLNRRFDTAYDWSQVTDVELAYLAGMIDGEGHIGLAPTHTSWIPMVVVTSTDETVMTWLTEHFGGNVVRHDRRDPRHKPRMNWRLDGRHATDLLGLVLPYLVIKPTQARLAISYYEQPSFQYGDRKLPQEEYDRRRQLHEQLKSLNKRGPTLT